IQQTLKPEPEPEPSCVSLKSDDSKYLFIDFKSDQPSAAKSSKNPFVKVTLNLLKKMKQEELAERLES
ncbi:hypothetical protein AMECASPLE_033415, partial [Ameca splendens]